MVEEQKPIFQEILDPKLPQDQFSINTNNNLTESNNITSNHHANLQTVSVNHPTSPFETENNNNNDLKPVPIPPAGLDQNTNQLNHQPPPSTSTISEFKNSTDPKSTRKTVSFLEISSDVPVNDTQDVFSVMLSGTQMVKIRSNTRLYERYFWLNEETNSIHWEPSKKDAATLHLSCIKEVRWGQTTKSVFKTNNTHYKKYFGVFPRVQGQKLKISKCTLITFLFYVFFTLFVLTRSNLQIPRDH